MSLNSRLDVGERQISRRIHDAKNSLEYWKKEYDLVVGAEKINLTRLKFVKEKIR